MRSDYTIRRTISSVIKNIGIWENLHGESFMDYAGSDHIFRNISFLMGYWSCKHRELYNFLIKKSNNTIPWKYAQDGLEELVEEFYGLEPEHMRNEEYLDCYDMTWIPWASIIVDNDIYWERYIKFMEEYE